MILMLDTCKGAAAGHLEMYMKNGGATAFVEFEMFADTENESEGNMTAAPLPLASVIEALPGTSLRPESMNINSKLCTSS